MMTSKDCGRCSDSERFFLRLIISVTSISTKYSPLKHINTADVVCKGNMA